MIVFLHSLLLFAAITRSDGACYGDCIGRMNNFHRVGTFDACEKCIYSDQCSQGMRCINGKQICKKKYQFTYCPRDIDNPECQCHSTERGLMTPSMCGCNIPIWLPNVWVQDGRNYSNDVGSHYIPERLADGRLSESDEFAYAIVCAHNFLRTANFSGTGIPPLKWNTHLAKFAYLHSKFLEYEVNCEMHHSSGRGNIPGYDGYAGENIFTHSNAKASPKIAISATLRWYREIEDYQYNEYSFNQCPKRNSAGLTGHFTQLMWAESTEIGCDYAECSDGKLLITCEYGPGGNIRNKPAFSKESQLALNSWSYNNKYNGLPGC